MDLALKINCLAALAVSAFASGLAGCAPTPTIEKTSALSPDCPAEMRAVDAGYWVCAIGSRESMLDSGDLSGSVSLSDLPQDPELIAVGPVEGLQGEITIYRGRRFVSVVSDGRDVTRSGSEARAIFLAFGSADAWAAIPISEPLEGFDAIEAFITAQAKIAGLPVENAFPFRIEGQAETLDYHVIFKTDGVSHNRASHRRSKIMFEADGATVSVSGIWADEASVGRYTHPGRRSHMHVVVGDGEGSGHIDGIRVASGSILYLPATGSYSGD